MKENGLFELLESKAEKWMNTNQQRKIIGTPKKGFNSTHSIDFYPRQISYTHREVTEIELVAEHGGLLTPIDTSTRKDYKLLVEARVGDLSNSYHQGVGRHWEEGDVAFENIKALNKGIDRFSDDALKMAFSRYFEAHEAVCDLDEEKFGKLSEEEPVEHIGEEMRINVDLNELGKHLEEASEYLSRIAYSGVEAKATIQKINKRFVSLERRLKDGKIQKSRIFSSDLGAYITFSAEVRDKNRQIMEYKHRIANLDINKILNRETIMSGCKFFAEEVKKRINCEVQDSGIYPVIVDSDALYTIAHEGAFAHLLSAKYILEEHATTFKNKIGELVMPEFIDVYNDPTIKDIWGAYEHDEDGIKSQRVALVEKGILRNYLHDRSTAGRMGIKSNGCCRASRLDLDAENMAPEEPMTEPRMGITEMRTSEPKSFEELKIGLRDLCKKKNLEYGLFVEGASGWVEISDGVFRINPKRLSRIYASDGRIEPISSAFIVGNPYTMLKNIIAMGDQQKIIPGFCGSDSGFIYASGIAPKALIDDVEFRIDEGDVIKGRLRPDKN